MSEPVPPELAGAMIDLCEVDHALTAVRHQLDLYGPMLEKLKAREAAAAAVQKAAEERIRSGRERRRKLELEIKTQRDAIARFLGQQAQVKTNKEYAAITHEIDGAKAKIDEAENQGLAALEDEERGEEERVKAVAAIEKLRAEGDAERARIAQQQTEKRERMASLEAERAERLARLPEPARDTYLTVDEVHPGEAVARLSGEACGGCGYQFTKQAVQALRRGESIIRCQNCSRLVIGGA